MQVRSRRSIALALCASVVAAVMVVATPGRAMAHTGFDFSLPAEGTTVGEPVELITVGFTDRVALVGNGFEVHDPQGNLLTPFVVTDDDKIFKFQFDPPLAGGVVVVDYHIRALDGDEQQGSFSFTVAAPVPTSTTPPATSAPATSAPLASTAPTAPPTTVAPSTAPIAPTTVASAPPGSTPPAASDDGESERTLMFAVLLGIAVLAAGFLVVTSRRTA